MEIKYNIIAQWIQQKHGVKKETSHNNNHIKNTDKCFLLNENYKLIVSIKIISKQIDTILVSTVVNENEASNDILQKIRIYG